MKNKSKQMDAKVLQALEKISVIFEGFKNLSAQNKETFFATLEAEFYDLITETDGQDPELEKFLLTLRDLFKSEIFAG
jgi:hypothetical protein